MLTVSQGLQTHAVIDGQAIAITVKRMTIAEASAFRRAYDRFTSPESIRKLTIRRSGEEMEKHPVPRPRTAAEITAAGALEALDAYEATEALDALPPIVQVVVDACRALVPPEPTDEAFVVSDAEIRRRRLEEMTPAARQAFDALDVREDEEADAFLAASIADFITVVPGQLTEIDADGQETPLTAGADLVRIFAARQDVLLELVNLIRAENMLPEAQKKALRSLFASLASSSAPAMDRAGSGPATTVDDVARRASARAEGVMASPETASPVSRPETSPAPESFGATAG